MTEKVIREQELAKLTATEATGKIATGDISVERYARVCLDRIEAHDAEIKAFVHIDREHVLAQARALESKRAQGELLGPLHGVPVAIKDIIDTADYPTELGSPLAAGRRPRRDATVVAKLRAAGAIIIGKTVSTEFAYYHPGPTSNPRDPSRTPGGSSSGSAAAVAADMVPLALGSQTNGSTIRPGAFCGVFAIKPSHGLISRAGVLTLSPKLDHLGAFARSLPDLALMLDVIAGPDAADPDTRAFAASSLRHVQNQRLSSAPRLAFVRTPIWDQANADTRSAFERLAKALGPAVVEVDLGEDFAAAWEVHRTIMATDMAHHLAAFVARGEPSAALRELLAHGRSVRALDYLEALDKAGRYAVRLAEILAEHDAIMTPATAGIAPKGLSSTGDPAFCTLWTLTGLPSLSLPLLQGEDGLPLGVQLVGAAGQDGPLLRTATALVSMLGNVNVRGATHQAH